MHKYYYEIEVSKEQHKLARNAVLELFQTMDTSADADVPMAKPVLAFAGYKVECRDYSDHPKGKFFGYSDFGVESRRATTPPR